MRFPTLLLLCTCPLLAVADPAFDSQVRSAAERVMRDNGVAGLAIAISDHGKQYFYEFGVADKATGQAVNRDTLFELGSISKTFTATLSARAQIDKRLSLHASAAEYLPELAGTAFGRLSLINLATHSNGGMPLQLPEGISNQAQLFDWLRHWQPEHAADGWRAYANPGIGMLGVITARQLGTSFVSAMQEQLLPELGLEHTYVQVPASQQALYARGYDKNDAPVRVNPGVLADEAYGVKSSSRDMLRYVEAHLGRVQLAAPLKQALDDTRRGYYQRGAMTQDLIWEHYDYPLALQTLLDGNDNRYALAGSPVNAINPPLAPQSKAWVNKTGATNGFGAYVAFVPEQQRAVVLLANRNYPNGERVKLAWRLFELLDEQR